MLDCRLDREYLKNSAWALETHGSVFPMYSQLFTSLFSSDSMIPCHLTFLHISYTLFSQRSRSPDSRQGLHQSALVWVPCYAAAVLSLSSHPIFLQRASGFIGIHRQCHQHTRVCYIPILSIIDSIDHSDCLTSRPQCWQPANSSWLHFSGAWGTFTECMWSKTKPICQNCTFSHLI